jgi:hypothetical protein
VAHRLVSTHRRVTYTPVPLHVLCLPANEGNRRGSITSTEELPQSIDPTRHRADRGHGTADRRRQGALALHDVAGRVRSAAEPRDRLDDWDLVPPRPCRGRDDRAVLGGRDGFNAYPDVSLIYGGAWQGPMFVLTHHPEDAQPAEGVTFLNWDVAEAVSKEFIRRAFSRISVRLVTQPLRDHALVLTGPSQPRT